MNYAKENENLKDYVEAAEAVMEVKDFIEGKEEEEGEDEQEEGDEEGDDKNKKKKPRSKIGKFTDATK